jgi:hypothetical protein
MYLPKHLQYLATQKTEKGQDTQCTCEVKAGCFRVDELANTAVLRSLQAVHVMR